MERDRDDDREEKRLRELAEKIAGEFALDGETEKKPGRPRVHSADARGFTVTLEPGHFDTLARVARANGLQSKGDAVRHLVDAAGDALWQGDD